jgi:hypothetical protein
VLGQKSDQNLRIKICQKSFWPKIEICLTPALRLATRLDEPLQNFGRRDLQVDEDGVQRRLDQLRRVVDRVAVEYDQLQRLGLEPIL